MKVSDVRIGDYVVGFGVVDNMMIFYKEIAHEFPSYPKMKYNKKNFRSTNLARMNTLEMDSCYKKEMDSVVLVGAGVRKTYTPDVVVQVYRREAA